MALVAQAVCVPDAMHLSFVMNICAARPSDFKRTEGCIMASMHNAHHLG